MPGTCSSPGFGRILGAPLQVGLFLLVLQGLSLAAELVEEEAPLLLLALRRGVAMPKQSLIKPSKMVKWSG